MTKPKFRISIYDENDDNESLYFQRKLIIITCKYLYVTGHNFICESLMSTLGLTYVIEREYRSVTK